MSISNLDYTKELIPLLWELTKKEERCAFNISSSGNEINISVLLGKKSKRFYRDPKITLKENIFDFVRDCKLHFGIY